MCFRRETLETESLRTHVPAIGVGGVFKGAIISRAGRRIHENEAGQCSKSIECRELTGALEVSAVAHA